MTAPTKRPKKQIEPYSRADGIARSLYVVARIAGERCGRWPGRDRGRRGCLNGVRDCIVDGVVSVLLQEVIEEYCEQIRDGASRVSVPQARAGVSVRRAERILAGTGALRALAGEV